RDSAAAADAAADLPADYLARLRSDLVRRAVDDDGGDGPGVPTGRADCLRGQRHRRCRPDEGLYGHQHSHAGDRRHHRAADDLPTDLAVAAADPAVSCRPALALAAASGPP